MSTNFPITEVLNGEPVSTFDETTTWQTAFAVLLAVQLRDGLTAAQELGDYSKEDERVAMAAFDGAANNFFEYAVENFKPEVTILVTRLMLVDWKMKFSVANIPMFNNAAKVYAGALADEG